jgi:hypothetical protein
VADSVTYLATIDTSSQNGNYGYVDLELNASGLSGVGPVVATVFNFSGTTLNPSDTNNDELGTASGSLPGPLTLDNSGFNDYFEGMTFGSDITFDVTLSGSGVSLTGGAAYTQGTLFQVLFCDATCTNNLFVSDPTYGAAVLLNVVPDGMVSGIGADPVTPVPEPGSLSLILCGCAGLLLAIRRRGAIVTAC